MYYLRHNSLSHILQVDTGQRTGNGGTGPPCPGGHTDPRLGNGRFRPAPLALPEAALAARA